MFVCKGRFLLRTSCARIGGGGVVCAPVVCGVCALVSDRVLVCVYGSTRAVVPVGPGPWSPASVLMATLSSVPAPPVLQPIPHSAVSFNSVALKWLRGNSNGDPVTSYDVQYRAVGDQKWSKVCATARRV